MKTLRIKALASATILATLTAASLVAPTAYAQQRGFPYREGPEKFRGDGLGRNEVLFAGEYIAQSSSNNAEGYYAVMQGDGNFVVYRSPHFVPQNAVWSTQTQGSGADRVVMQADGNFVVYRPTTRYLPEEAVWRSGIVRDFVPEGLGYKGVYLILWGSGNVATFYKGELTWNSPYDRHPNPRAPVTTMPPKPITVVPPPSHPNVSFDVANLTLNGSGFSPNATVYIRVVTTGPIGRLLDTRTGNTRATSDGQGKLSARLDLTSVLPVFDDGYGVRWLGCYPEQQVTINANDNRWDSAKNDYLWSKPATFTCPGKPPF